MRGTFPSLHFSGLLIGVGAILILGFGSSPLNASESSNFSVDRGMSRTCTKHGGTTQYRNIGKTVVRTQDWPFRWEPDSTKKITLVEIKLEEQRLYVYQGALLVGEAPVSTGRPGYDTPAGKYSVLVKELEHFSNMYGELVDGKGRVVNMSAEAGDPIPKGLRYRPSPMPYFLRLTDSGTGMHIGFLPGYAASHGCIRLPRKFAPLLFEAVPIGTSVIISGATKAPEPKIAKDESHSGSQASR